MVKKPVIILTHPCAGKTYYAKRDDRVTDCPSRDGYVEGDYVFVCKGHKHYDKYDAVVALDAKTLKRNIKKRQKQKNKTYKDFHIIINERNKVINFAKSNNLRIFDSIIECINYYEQTT